VSWTPGTGLSNPDSGFSDGGFRRPGEGCTRSTGGRIRAGITLEYRMPTMDPKVVLRPWVRSEGAYDTGTLTRTTVSGLFSSWRERPFGQVYWRERPFGRVDSSHAWGCRQSRHRE
jgi:hypothetical protein